ncbi:ankyrin repeat domain-containing protein [Rubrimonas cliftonensis]|uniref:Ankyrin repeat-containing protein n=1 Tax=Rubrimonas cliftonensis TaxID=89524 RepID=A0A1H3VGS7_9RHOB|nr:ankyrin repeat domain-containing protein [Rubrimonas cliftonensis]SDZ74017.1 Ankyrin repeat-containing protein [Rubrimonas cliftonensis]
MRRLTLIALLAAAPALAQDDAARLFALIGPGRGPALALELEVGAFGAELEARDAEMATPLHRAAESVGDGDLIRAMVERGANPRALDANGLSPLHYAARAGAPVGVLAALLGAGADPLARDARGETALHMAKDATTAALLVAAGADACGKDARGAPALPAETLERIRIETPELYGVARAAFLDCL